MTRILIKRSIGNELKKIKSAMNLVNNNLLLFNLFKIHCCFLQIPVYSYRIITSKIIIMIKNVLNNKLKSYSALAGSVLAVAGSADAQIIYTDVNPDTLMNSTLGSLITYDVDFDNNGITDMSVGTYAYAYGGSNLNYSFNFLSPDAVSAAIGTIDANYSLPTPTPLASGVFVDPASVNWLDTTASGGTTQFNAATFMGTTLLGTFNTGADAYIGARFLIGANTHYGWIRINVSADCSTTTVKDFAYKAVPNTGLNTGETGLGINEILSSTWSAAVNGKNIIVKSENDAAVTIIDVTGREIATGNVENGIATIALPDASTGLYLVRMQQGTSTGSKKVILN